MAPGDGMKPSSVLELFEWLAVFRRLTRRSLSSEAAG